MPPDPTSALDAPIHDGSSPGGDPASPRRRGLNVTDDPDLIALPAPPKGERTTAVVLMLVTAIAATWMALALRGEVRYALSPGQPLDLGDLASLRPMEDLANRYVHAAGLLGTRGAIRYGRAAESDSFRLAPIAGNAGIWVEIRVPEGFEGPRFVPPTTFAGRLVPFSHAGLRHASLADSVRDQTQEAIPEGAWLLIDGGSPRASRWAVALAGLFLLFAGWNVVGVVRVLRRVRDASPSA